MKFIYTVILPFVFSVNLFSQECGFDPYQKKGGLYYFCSFYQNYDQKQLREGVCSKDANGKPYEYREFKNGQLQVEKCYVLGTSQTYSEFKRVKKDSIIAQLIYKQDGSNLELKQIFYLNNEGKRCWKEENYRQGKIYQVRYFRNFQNEELVKAGYAARPEHVIDAEGYCDVSAQFGTETMYYPNGRVMSIAEHHLIVSDSPNNFPSQHGKYLFYGENGVEIQRGCYANGAANGDFVYHHPNGKLFAKRSFENGIAVGNWIEYYDNGKVASTIEYGEQYWWPTGHEKRFFESGIQSYERKIEKNGLGFQTEYYPDGKVKEHIVYAHGPSEKTENFTYYPSGLLKSKIYLRPKNDTLVAEFFEDGTLSRINLTPTGSFTSQEIRDYYPSHQLKSFNKTNFDSGKTDQTVYRYYENGNFEYKLERVNKISSESYFYSTGILKSRCEYVNDSLNGTWTEQDSTGQLTKKYYYEKGFKSDAMGVFQFPKLPSVSKEESLELKQYLISRTVNGFYIEQKPYLVKKQELAKRLKAAERLLAYHHYMNKNWPLTPTGDTSSVFIYHMELPQTLFEGKRALLDSCFSVLSWNVVSTTQNVNSSTYIELSGDDFYNHAYLKVLFDNVFKENGNRITYYVNIQKSIDFDMWMKSEIALSMQRIDFASAYKVTIGSSAFVVYDSGEIEPFNGKAMGYFYTKDEPVLPYGMMYKD